MSLASIGLAALAGILSTISPCVLPLIPMVLGAAISEHRHGPVALAAGLAVSFVGIGLFIATIGYSLGFDGGLFRIIGAALLIALGLVLLLPALQTPLLRDRSAAGPTAASGALPPRVCAGSSPLDCSWASSGALALVPPSARPPCSRLAVRTWGKWRW